jgi:hypothetical protein
LDIACQVPEGIYKGLAGGSEVFRSYSYKAGTTVIRGVFNMTSTPNQMLHSAYDDIAWLQENFDALKVHHHDKFIALANKKIVASANSLTSLFRRLELKECDLRDVLIYFVDNERVLR